MSSLLSPQIDFVFKNIFGVEGKEPLLISFLNSLFKGNPVVKSLTLGNTDICKTRHDGKSNRLDVRATIDDGTQLDIEIQCHNTEEIPQRALNYLANLMPEVINEGESYVVSKAIGIWILGENIIKKRKAAITECYMATLPHDPEPYYIDNMRLIFIELPKFCPQDAPAQDLLTGWLAFLKDPVGMDKTYMKVQEVKEAMNTLKYISSDKKLREAALLRQREINDRHSEMTVAIQRGEARGKALGEVIGEARGEARGKAIGESIGEAKIKTKIAISMLEKGLSLDVISDYTGMSVHEINTIQKDGKLNAEM